MKVSTQQDGIWGQRFRFAAQHRERGARQAGVRRTDAEGCWVLRVVAPIGSVMIAARGYPSMYDGGEVESKAVVLADGSGTAKVMIPRRGRIAITLRDTAAADRIDDQFSADVAVADEQLVDFVYTEGNIETTASEPPLGRKLDTLQLLPPGSHEVSVTAEGWLPAKAKVEVRADQVTEVAVWLQKR